MQVTKLDPPDKPTTVMTVTDAQLTLIKRTIAAGATDEELQLFFYDCQRHGVHPLDRMIHFTKRSGKYTPITSIDLMRSRAAETGEMAGSDDAVFDVKRPARPAVATVTVYRLTQGGRYPYTASASWDEYYPGEGQPGFMWRRLPRTMLAKCAEALALRKAFPKQLHGLYAAEEMHQAEDSPSRQPEAGALGPSPTTDLAPDGESESPEDLFQPMPQDDEERNILAADATRLAIKLKLKEEAKATYRNTYLGGSDPMDPKLDIVALKELVNVLRARAGEKKV
jgi:phage recombination protein Bet